MAEAEITFKTLYKNEDDDWIPSGAKITSAENLTKIKRILEDVGSVVVEHWFYRLSRAPERIVFNSYDEFLDYLDGHAHAGDIIDAWSLHELINQKNKLASGKCPAEDGCIPRKGSY